MFYWVSARLNADGSQIVQYQSNFVKRCVLQMACQKYATGSEQQTIMKRKY